MDVIFQTRFSFYGRSGWKSAAAGDPALLFDPARLDARLALFEAITLPSLVAQSDGDFTHMILSSSLMPEPYQARLRALVSDTLGAGRAQFEFRPDGHAGSYLRSAVHKRFGERMVAQVVLDDDDALACDFSAELRRHAPLALTASGDGQQEDHVFMSFPRGFTLGIEAGAPSWLERRYVPYTNLGLTLIAPASSKRNPFTVSHRKVGHRHPSLMITHLRPYYLRAVHRHNDSDALRQKKRLHPGDIDAARALFPFLAPHFPPESTAAAE